MAKSKNNRNKKNARKSTIQVETRPKSKTGTGPVYVKSVNEFEDYLDAPEPVIVDFWASWCGPCKMMSPIFDEVAKKFDGQVHFLKVNTEELPELAGAFGIRSIPTLLVLHGRDVTNSTVGLTDKTRLEGIAQKALNKSSGGTFAKVKKLFGVSSQSAQA